MVCGRLARSIARVIFGKRMLTREKLFTLPKPRIHLVCLFVNIVPAESIRRGGAGLH